MERSESLIKFSQAFLKAQKKIENAIKDSLNPHFRSKYAGLPEVMEACKEHLNDEGIAIFQPIVSTDQGDFVETVLIHSESGEFISSKMKLILDKTNMQAMGSAITYGRRYLLSSLVFISSEDDDGESTMSRAPKSDHEAKCQQALNKASDLATKEIGQGFRKKPTPGGL